MHVQRSTIGFDLRFGRLLAMAAILAPVPVSGQHFRPTDDLELMLRYRVEDGTTPGVALGLVDADGSTAVLSSGSGGPDGTALGPESVFELGHLTMTFTATLLALMAERGDVSLDDPASKYLPAAVQVPSVAGRPITLGDLARHRSGLPAEPPKPYDRFTIEDLYSFLSDYRPRYTPGQEFEFSTLGYGLLGHVLARAAGTSLPDLLRRGLLEPLGMSHTGYAGEGAGQDRLVRGHDDGEVVSHSIPTAALQGATGLRSTPADMVAFLAANARPPETDLGRAMRVAQEVRGSNDRTGEGRGFSWRQYVEGSEPLLVTHAGHTRGFTSLITFDAARGIGTVVLANSRGFTPWFSRNLLWLSPWVSGPPHEVDPGRMHAYTGTYSTTVGRYTAGRNRGRHFVRLEENGQLTYQRQEGVRIPLRPRTDISFYMVGAPFTLAFSERGGRMQMVASVDERESLRQQGQRWRAWKVDDDTPPPGEVAAGPRLSPALLAGLLAALGLAVALPLWRSLRRA